MAFNSYPFLFVFLPLSLYGFFKLAQHWGKAPALAYLLLCSFSFYAFSMRAWAAVLGLSIGFNYAVGAALQAKATKGILLLGIGVNVAVLAFFKYGVLFFPQGGLIFPLALSFFTFQQLAYLVDSYRQIFPQKPSLLHYALGVCFFPLVTAGPISRHAHLIPQWLEDKTYGFHPQNCALGLSIFVIGLFKKVVLADAWFAPTTDLLFGGLKHGVHLSLIEAWMATLSYTFQIYFDFSGYSEMALGLAYCLNIQLPLNFYAPYKSTSIIQFWRSWHMSLSNFLKDYVYIPLGGNRCGPFREVCNIFLVMLVGGIWHGATLNFLAWGALHGLYVSLNHLWRKLRSTWSFNPEHKRLYRYAMQGLTFLAVAFAWALFRADSLQSAYILFRGMLGMESFFLPPRLSTWMFLKDCFPSVLFSKMGFLLQDQRSILYVLAKAFAIVWLLPSVPDIFHLAPKDTDTKGTYACLRFSWKPSQLWVIGLALLFVYTVLSLQGYQGQFVYYQF